MRREAGTEGENDGEEGGISGVQDTGQGVKRTRDEHRIRCSVTTVTATD